VSIWAGQNGNESQGQSSAGRFWVHPKWEKDRHDDFDVGIVFLPDDRLPKALGWFGRGAFSDGRLVDMLVNTAGYPLDKSLNGVAWLQWFDADRIRSIDPGFIYYDFDTDNGQSGAPVFLKDGDVRTVVGIHVGSKGSLNRAVRITDELFDWIGGFENG
jgi:V8-like Glu-specific endopeptidase